MTAMTRALGFAKYEGLGNDFIVVEAGDEGEISSELAVRLCDRRLGIGADGVLLVLPSRSLDCLVRMRVINADGSVPEMCGNGIRCVALSVARIGQPQVGALRIDTDAGPRPCLVEDDRGQGIVTVEMGRVGVVGPRMLVVDGIEVELTVVDAGNPHAVLLGPFSRGDVERLGPPIAVHPDFPRGTNVEFASIKSDGIDLTVWERGVGITSACGTGACATVAAAYAKGLVAAGPVVPVRLPGGILDIAIDCRAVMTMRGPARHVFSGTVTVD